MKYYEIWYIMKLIRIFTLIILLFEYVCPSSTKNSGNDYYNDNNDNNFNEYNYEYDNYYNYDNYYYQYVDDTYQDDDIIIDNPRGYVRNFNQRVH